MEGDKRTSIKKKEERKKGEEEEKPRPVEKFWAVLLFELTHTHTPYSSLDSPVMAETG